MQQSKKFAFDVGSTFVASAITLPLSVIVTILLARYSGAINLGMYSLTLSICGIMTIVGTFGLQSAVIKYVAEFNEDKREVSRIVSSAVFTSAFFGVIFASIFFLLSAKFEEFFRMPGLANLLQIVALIFPFSFVGSILLGFLNGLREIKKRSLAVVFQGLMTTISSIFLIYIGLGARGAIIGVAISSILSCLFLIYLSKAHFKITLENYFVTTKKLIDFGWKIVTTNLINQVNYQADTFLIAFFLSPIDVGFYAVATGLSKFFWIIPDSIQTISYPATSKFWGEKNLSAVNKIINKCMEYTACILFPIGLGICFFSKDIIQLLYGEKFLPAVVPLCILILGTVLFGVFKSVGGFLSGVGRPDIAFKINNIGAVSNVTLNIMLISTFGISGAALSTITALLIVAGISVYMMIKMAKTKIDTSFYKRLISITIFSIVLFMFLNSLKSYFYIYGLIILIGYMISIFLFILTEEDRRALWFMLKSFNK